MSNIRATKAVADTGATFSSGRELQQWLASDGLPIGTLDARLNPNRRGLVRASVMAEAGKLLLTYLGPDELWLA